MQYFETRYKELVTEKDALLKKIKDAATLGTERQHKQDLEIINARINELEILKQHYDGNQSKDGDA